MEKDMQENIKLEESEKIKKITKQLLKEIGVKVHISGFNYWITALSLAIETMCSGRNIKMRDLYQEIGKIHKVSSSSVERAMRYAHEGLNIKKIFNVKYSITNNVLLFLLIEEVLDRMNV